MTNLVEHYYREQGLFRTDQSPDPCFTESIEINLGEIEPALSGPKRPQDRIILSEMKRAWHRALAAPTNERGFDLEETDRSTRISLKLNDATANEIGHGAVVIAAITSCTNTSNPSVMLAAGLLAKRAVEKGLKVPPHVKTSLAPGSRAVTDYLKQAGLSKPLEELGFYSVGYGCTTCIGNSGPLPDAVTEAIRSGNLVAASVLSGNRNFEGRVHPAVKANYLASPPLVVAYAIAGTVDIDLTTEPIGHDRSGNPVFLKDVWPTASEILKALDHAPGSGSVSARLC